MRYLDLLKLSLTENEGYYKVSSTKFSKENHGDERTKKGGEVGQPQTARWISPKLGRCEGAILDRDGGWLLVAIEKSSHGFAWIKL